MRPVEDQTYWPFRVLPEKERTEQHRLEIALLERARNQGFKPYAFGTGNYSATSESSARSGDLLVRGRHRWEVALCTEGGRVASGFVDDFASAAEAVLSWLGGGDIPTVLTKIEHHLAVMPGSNRIFVVYAHSNATA